MSDIIEVLRANPLVLLVLLGAAGAAGAGFLLFRHEQQRVDRDLHRLTRRLGGALSGRRGTALRDGTPFEYRWTQDLETTTFVIAVGRPDEAGWMVRRRSATQTFLEESGLDEMQQTGDASFDRDFAVEDPGTSGVAEALGRFPEYRAAVRELIKLRPERIEATGAKLSVVWSTRSPNVPAIPEPATVEAVVDRLRLLSNVPDAPVHRRHEARSAVPVDARRPLPTGMVSSVGAPRAERPALRPPRPRPTESYGGLLYPALALAGLSGMAILFGRYRVVEDIDGRILVIVGMCAGSILALIAFRRAGRDEEARRRRGWIALFAFMFGVMLGFAGTHSVNGMLDWSPTVAHTVQVRNTRIERTANFGSTRVVEVESWRPGRQTERLVVTREEFEQARAGRRLTIALKAGALGYPWIVWLRPAP